MFESKVFSNLKKIWSTANADYEHYKSVCEAEVVWWQWASSHHFPLEPYEQEICGLSGRTKIFEEKPEMIGWHSEYGFDHLSRLRVARNYMGSVDDLRESFVLDTNDGYLEVTYEAILCRVKQVRGIISYAGRIINSGRLQPNLYTELTYNYDNDSLLLSIVSRSRALRQKNLGKVKDLIASRPDIETIEYIFVYDDDGLKFVREVPPISRRARGVGGDIIYFRKNTLTQEELLPKLVDQIRQVIAEFKTNYPDEDWYSFSLAYDHLGDIYRCAFGTEQALSLSAMRYEQDGYRFKCGDNFQLLRCLLRYSPWDSVHFYRLKADRSLLFNQERNGWHWLGWQWQADLRTLSIKALIQLDSEGAFGIGADRERIAIGVSMGLNPIQFAATARVLNPRVVARRLFSEFGQIRRLSAPGMLEVTPPESPTEAGIK